MAACASAVLPFGHADEVRGVFGRDSDGERLRIGVADVLGGEAHQAPRDVERILAGLEHARQPVDGGIRIAVAHRLVQRGDDVVVLFAALVVEQRPSLDRALEPRAGRPAVAVGPRRGLTASSSMFSAERASPLASARSRQRLVVDVERLAAQAALASASARRRIVTIVARSSGPGRRPSSATAARR